MFCNSQCSHGDEALLFSPVLTEYNAVDNAGNESNKEHGKFTLTADSIRVASLPQIKPSTAMYHSLILPGWGQINNGSKKKAAFFLIAEMVCIGGYIYVNHEINHGDYTAWKENLSTDRNTFLLYWIISKFFGMVDAYVDAQLADYNVRDITPDDLKRE